MPPPDTSASPAYGVRSPRIFDGKLKLDPQLAALAPPFPFTIGWQMQLRLTYSPVPLGLTLGSLDDALAPYLAKLSTLTAAQPNQPMAKLLPQAMAGAANDSKLLDQIRDAVADAAQDKFWAKIPAPGRNFANGEPASIGTICPGSVDSSGYVLPPGSLVYDDLDKVVPGTQLKSTYLLKPWSLGKRFPFASGNDVYFKLYVDKDALDGKAAALVSGGSITLEGKTSDGQKRSLLIVGGRDQVGGAAGAVVIQGTFW